MKTIASIVLVAALLAGADAGAALAPAAHPLFDGDAVHEISLTFDQADWWAQLTANFENYDDPPYLAAAVDFGAVHLDSIGVRFKGNSSYWSYYGDKKSFKLDLNEFIGGQDYEGLDKLNLNNCFLDPSFVREKAAYELCDAMGMATGRTNYAALTINGTFWGLYLLVEQQDTEFIESRWGVGENGNQWKGEPYGSLEYLGPNEADYYADYELKTNEEVNDWSDLVDFVDILNNTPVAALPDSLHNRLDVNSALAMLALDLFTVNLDSYIGRCANYYFYHRERDDRFVFTKWDMNEAFGVFDMWNMSPTQKQQLSPYWTNPITGEDRPMAEQLWQIPAYQAVYEGHMKKLMAGAAAPATLVARMEELRDLVRPWVYLDTNNMFTTSQFEACMTSDVFAAGGPPPGRLIPALQTFIQNRDSYLRSVLGAWTPIEGLVINEVMAKNSATAADEAGDYDDWIEIANTGPIAVDLEGLGLTDHFEGAADFVFPAMILEPGEYLVVWADEEPAEGDLHAPFKLDADGEEIFLTQDGVIVDQVMFPALGPDVSFGRWPDGGDSWQQLTLATPGAANQNPVEPEVVNLVINEFLASNDTGITDEMGEFEDWVEIHNPGPADVAMGGLFLTDDLALPTQWAFPDTTLPAGGYLVVWCDSDVADGPLHASFKLGAGGEDIGLFGRLAAGNEVIDSYTFGAQSADVSEGRDPAGDGWTFFTTPTPGAANAGSSDVPGARPAALALSAAPNPFNPTTTLAFDLPGAARVAVDVYDLRGRHVRRLAAGDAVAGRLTLTWDGRDDGGRSLPSGAYLVRARADADTRVLKITLAK